MKNKQKKLKIVALIPLKGKSRSIPYKNIKEMAGKPLSYYVCKAAHDSKYVQQIYVSTEDSKIKQVVNSFDMKIKFIPEILIEEKNISVLEKVISNFINHVNDFDILLTMQATSPLTTGKDIDMAIEKMLEGGYDSMLTGVLLKRFFWHKSGYPLNYNYLQRPLRQVFEGTTMENGAFYLTKKHIFEKFKNRLGGKIGIYHMLPETATEIDEPCDWEEVERHFLKKYGKK